MYMYHYMPATEICTLATLFIHFPLLHLQKQSSKKSREDNISTCHCVLLIIKIHVEVVKNILGTVQ